MGRFIQGMSGGDTVSDVHVLGVRHHGPGSARHVRAQLEKLRPDVVLIEGPPEGNEIIGMAKESGMEPPVSLLIYDPDELSQAAFYPFVIYSPEWQAIQYALSENIPVRFIDLDQSMRFGLGDESDQQVLEVESDPLGALGEAAGFEDGEIWWEQMVEQRVDGTELFEGIIMAMAAVREENAQSKTTLVREAAMRQEIRSAIKEGHDVISVVCGAWHTPALDVFNDKKTHGFTVQGDKELLKGLKKKKVVATWIPWTYGRLSRWSGYGAGVRSPGWYHHLWEYPDKNVYAARWLSRVAHLFREKDMDASPAQVIDALQFGNTLAVIRDRLYPSLDELNEAVLTTFCHGYDEPMQLIHDELIISNRMGVVPSTAPTVPLQQDFEQQVKRLRMKTEATEKILKLDLRKKSHLARSHFLHRLLLLGVNWGKKEQVERQLGTFNELWKLQWLPEMRLRIIEQNVWGNTVESAAESYVRHLVNETDVLPEVTTLINGVLLANLSGVMGDVVQRLEDIVAITTDVVELMVGLPPLVDALTYGDVRKTDVSMLSTLIDGMVTRICIGLPLACSGLADDAAEQFLLVLIHCQKSLRLLEDGSHKNATTQNALWYKVLNQIADQEGVHGMIRARCARILFDNNLASIEQVTKWMRLSVAMASDPLDAAAWLTGFLKDSGLVLVHNRSLLKIVDDWVMRLQEDQFVGLLPLLRRIFVTFSSGERKEIGMLIRRLIKGENLENEDSKVEFDTDRGQEALDIFAEFLGV